MTNESDRSAICIVGDSRSGSTVFQGLVELHRDATAVGELRRLEKFIAEGLLCSCGQPVTECAHWRGIMQRANLAPAKIRTQPPAQKILRRLEEAAGFAGVALKATPLTRPLLPRGVKVADHAARLLMAAADLAQARVVVDNSKDPGHAVYLLHQRVIPAHIVFIVRDGRATVWSKMRRTGISIHTAARHWARTTRAMLAMYRMLGSERSTWIRYEDLCADPRWTMDDFAERLGLDPGGFLPAPVHPQHHIGGTPGFSGITFDAIRLDTRWRDEMPAAAVTQFESIAGDLNRRLGYQ
jgi:hypothetical protein